MTLRRKTLIIISVIFVCLVAIIFGISRMILLGGFAQVEKDNTYQNVERASSALADEGTALDRTTHDWAAWDDTYAFIEDNNLDYIETNLLDQTFTSLRVNVMLYINASGSMVFGKAFDLQNEENMTIPSGLQEHLSVNDVLLHHDDPTSSTVGLISLPDKPMLIASRPIITSEAEGPIRGTLIMGRYLDDAEVQTLAGVTHLALTVHPLSNSTMPSDFQAIRPSLSEESPIMVKPLSSQTVAGCALLNDIYGKPVLVLRVDLPRDIYQQGQKSMRILLGELCAVGLIFGAVILLVLEILVLRRMNRLTTDVSSISASGDSSARVVMNGKDELSHLAGNINQMLEILRQSADKHRLLEESAIQTIATIADIRDPYTAGHQRRVAKLACAIAEELGLPRQQIEGIRVAALIHDIGKIYVPADILSKPGKLSEIEFNLVKNHPGVSYEILKGMEFPWPLADIAQQHHERLDGSGYPEGRQGKDILLEAKILSVADVVEAMCSHRPYRAALGIDKALEEISRSKGILYDPALVEACVKLFTQKRFQFEEEKHSP